MPTFTTFLPACSPNAVYTPSLTGIEAGPFSSGDFGGAYKKTQRWTGLLPLVPPILGMKTGDCCIRLLVRTSNASLVLASMISMNWLSSILRALVWSSPTVQATIQSSWTNALQRLQTAICRLLPGSKAAPSPRTGRNTPFVCSLHNKQKRGSVRAWRS